FYQLFLWVNILHIIIAKSTSSENAHQIAEGQRIIACVLQRLPGAFEEKTVLRVQHHRFARSIAKKRGIKAVNADKRSTRFHIVGKRQQPGVNASSQQLFLRKSANRRTPGGNILPERLWSGRARKASRHAYQG